MSPCADGALLVWIRRPWKIPRVIGRHQRVMEVFRFSASELNHDRSAMSASRPNTRCLLLRDGGCDNDLSSHEVIATLGYPLMMQGMLVSTASTSL